VNFAVHFIRTRSSLILTCSSGSFLFYILLVGVVEGKKRIVDRERGERWRKSVSLQ